MIGRKNNTLVNHLLMIFQMNDDTISVNYIHRNIARIHVGHLVAPANVCLKIG